MLGRSDIVVKQTGCTGRCSQEPILVCAYLNQIGVKYEKVTTDNVAEIFQKHIIGKKPVTSMMLDKKSDIIYDYVVTFCDTRTLN